MLQENESEYHFLKSSFGLHIFVVNGSKIYDVDFDIGISKIKGGSKEPMDPYTGTSTNDMSDLWKLISSQNSRKYISKDPLKPPPLTSISLNVSQSCNMTCGYCYADAGKFGGNARMMDIKVAEDTVNNLIANAYPNSDLVLGFMGGEPLLNSKLIHHITKYASSVAKQSNHRIRFSLTTNGSLIKKEDVELFSKYPYTLSISVDGNKEENDSFRRMNDKSSNYDHLISALEKFDKYGRPNHLAARVTVTPKTGNILSILDHLIDIGFDEVGFSAVVVSPDPNLAFSSKDFDSFLENMIICGKKALSKLKGGNRYPFGNFETAMHEIHKGTHRPYPCGAGAGYLSANAEGQLFACHRLIDDPQFAMGDIHKGPDYDSRLNHLSKMHVDSIQPCDRCWARYLCGGGCYHEVSRRGRIACDYIRGWLDFCLSAYVELSTTRSEYFLDIDRKASNVSGASTVASMD